METNLSKWKLLGYALIGFCSFMLSSANSNAAAVDTVNNNFTMLASDGSFIGGSNDVHFTWDGTKKTSVALSGQFSNAIISSSCLFFGHTWAAHDVAIYGPGTYTIYDGCAAGSPGCGVGNPVTFTVGSGQLGGHMLFNWNGSYDIDVVDVWQPGVFGPSMLWTGTCGSNSAAKVWDMMSTDWDGDGINGAPMTDGPFAGSNASFNLMGAPVHNLVDTANNNFTMMNGGGLNTIIGGSNDVRFIWDGTRKTSVAASHQVSNAALSSTCPFFGFTWSTHDMAIYGPGTYTVYSGCPAGSPGCGLVAPGYLPVTFTVGQGELGVHVLLDWDVTTDIDLVNVWTPHAVFGPSPMCTNNPDVSYCSNQNTCGGTPDTPRDWVWDWMSKDWDGDGINGSPFVDGPFIGFSGNFNVMGIPPLACTSDEQCNDNNACTADSCVNSACVHAPIAGCCNVAADCNDNNFCTADTCVGNACVHTPVSCDDSNACTTDSCNPAIGCIFTPINCDDNNTCTIDKCDSATGQCGHTPINCVVNTTNNNFTMISAEGFAITGGTNDVRFIWDGTRKTSVAASHQASNAALFTTCPFFGFTWSTHDVAIYGPGTYTVYTACPAGSPGCGLVAPGYPPVTFTVGQGELGVHVLLDWNVSRDIDLVNVWTPHAVFGPSPMYTGACGSNPSGKVWDWMSKDWDGDGINGSPFVDGPFIGFNGNFNVMGIPPLGCTSDEQCDDNNACTTDICSAGLCQHGPVLCVHTVCETATCNPAIGCVSTPVTCPEGQVCDPANGVCIAACITNEQCNDNNACTTDICSAGLCQHGPVFCVHRVCETAMCDPAIGCVRTPVSCPTGQVCDPTNGTCIAACTTNEQCNDNNACTGDICISGVCQHGPVACIHTLCETATCDPAIGCVRTPILCNDNNACTTDSCDPATGCVYTAISCDDNNICTTDTCDPVQGCVHTQKTGCVICPVGSPTTVMLTGGGQNPNTVDKEIQTSFTVMNHSGCILSFTKSSVTVSVGTMLQYDVTAGVGPQPSSCTWNNAAVPCGTNQITLTTSGTAGKLVLDNKANGGSDTDRIIISAQ